MPFSNLNPAFITFHFEAVSEVSSVINYIHEKGIKVGIIRPITLWPFPYEAFEKALEGKKKTFLAVEMSMGQMVEDVKLAVNGKVPVHFFGRTGGNIPYPNEVIEEVKKLIGGDK